MQRVEFAKQKSIVHEYVGTFAKAYLHIHTQRTAEALRGVFLNICKLHLLSGTVFPRPQLAYRFILKVIGFNSSFLCVTHENLQWKFYFSLSLGT